MIYHLAIIVSVNESLIYLLNYGMMAGSGGVLTYKAKSNTYMTMPLLATKAERRSYNGYYHIDGSGWYKASG
jgi:hypothetical protein